MTDSVSKTPETAATPAETAAAAAAEGAGASSQMTDTPQPAQADTLSPTAIAPVSAVTAPPAEPHELVLIDYQEATLHSLEDFCKLQGSARVQKEDLDAMVLNISKTGQVCYPWDLVKLYLAFRLEIILNKFHKEKGFKPYNKDDTYQPRYDDLFAQLLDFPAAPFTIQRLCEVIVRPEHYTQTNALLFGLEKMVSVSTVQKTLTPAEVERVNATLTAAHQAAAAVPERPTVPTKDTVIDVPARPAEDPETKMV